jgi:protein-serine/threonine kinase
MRLGNSRLDTSEPSNPPSRNEIRITKNYSTGNLLSHASSASLAINNVPQRMSLDTTALLDINKLSKYVRRRKPCAIPGIRAVGVDRPSLNRSPIIPEHPGEHGLGLSGLRRIRQQPGVAPANSSSTTTTATSRSASLTLPMPSRKNSSTMQSAPTSPGLTFSTDLSRFPTESLHSFSFAHQPEDSIHTRQNVLKRSIDFMRDKKGWAASNPGLVSAQARLSGDAGVQSMIDLLARSNLIGEEANQAHGLGLHGPLTGPADLSGEDIFARHLNMPRSESPESFQDSESPKSPPQASDASSEQKSPTQERLSSETTLDSLSKAATDDTTHHGVLPAQPRPALKRTFTNLDDLAVETKLTETLAKPYSVSDHVPESMISPRTAVPNQPLSIIPPAANSNAHIGPHSAAPHGHGSRWAPAAQAIFTTEANAPWTITAANDLACLVFGVTRAEVRKLGILEVVREERRKWLEEKLRDPDAGSTKGRGYSQSQRTSPNPTTNLNVGNGITAKLLSKPSSRQVAASRRSQTEDGNGMYAFKGKVKGGLNHAANKSRGVLLCGDVVPIQKRNGAMGSASLWVKEKKGGLIWVLEEIAEDVAYVSVDEVGCVTKAQGATEAIWGDERMRAGMDIKRLIPDIPRRQDTYTGALDYPLISELRSFTARTSNSINIPVSVEQLSGESTFRISSFPHIAGIMVINSSNLRVQSTNSVFSSALFGYPHPEGLHVNDMLPSFDRLLHLMTDEDKIRLVEGIVIPEHSFRRARALLAMRDGLADAAAIFFKPSGLPARHRDGSEIMVDVQMRVVKSERAPQANENVIIEVDEELAAGASRPALRSAEVVYALWITYSRQLHAVNHGIGPVTPRLSRPGTPPHQPSPGQSTTLPAPEEADSEGFGSGLAKSVSLLTQQLKGEIPATPVATAAEQPPAQPPAPPARAEPPKKKTINDFVVLEDMGQGAYGQVKLCRYKKNSQKKKVIKYVTKRRILVDTWTRDRRLGTVPLEIHVLDYLRRDGFKHPNIVEMSDFFEDDVNYYIEMVPHGLPGMDLFDYIELRVNMDEVECRKIFVQVANALWHLHIKAKVVHRDIKDENVILDGEGNIKLIDFGSAAYIKNGPFDVFVGTIGKSPSYLLRAFPH